MQITTGQPLPEIPLCTINYQIKGILGLSKSNAGLVLLLGQIFDAIFNIFIGAESDKISLIRGYGRRKGWHLIGSVFCIGI